MYNYILYTNNILYVVYNYILIMYIYIIKYNFTYICIYKIKSQPTLLLVLMAILALPLAIYSWLL